jgi:hypothetical protein
MARVVGSVHTRQVNGGPAGAWDRRSLGWHGMLRILCIRCRCEAARGGRQAAL